MELLRPYDREAAKTAKFGHSWFGENMWENHSPLPMSAHRDEQDCDKSYETDVIMFRDMYKKNNEEMNYESFLANGKRRSSARHGGPHFSPFPYGMLSESARNLGTGNFIEKDMESVNGLNIRRHSDDLDVHRHSLGSKLYSGKSFYEAYNSIDSRNGRCNSLFDASKSFEREMTLENSSSDYRNIVLGKSRMNELSHGNELTSYKLKQAGRPELTQSLSYSTTDRQAETGSAGIRNTSTVGQSFSPLQNAPIMAADQEEGAMNLSSEAKQPPSGESGTSVAVSGAPSPESGAEMETQGLPSPQTSNATHSKYPLSLTSTSAPVTSVPTSIPSKRKSRPPSQNPSSGCVSPTATNGAQSILMLAAQQGLSPQQMQQLLVAAAANQQSAGAGLVPPPSLQQIMQAQQTAVMQQQQKVQEQALLQLNEQLQLNILQQSQLLQDKKTNGKQHTQQTLQQLGMQQQQLVQQIQQLQLQQRQFLLACLMQQPLAAQQGVVSPADMHQLWKDLAGGSHSGSGSEDGGHTKGTTNGLGAGLAGLNGLGLAAAAASGAGNPLLQAGHLLGMNGLAHDAFPFAGQLIGQPPITVKQEEGLNPLFRHGLCKWPGCDTECKDTSDFNKHLNNEHTLDDKNTAQARVQMQIVSQLEIQLSREKELLHAMMQHLHLRPQREAREERDTESKISEKILSSPKLSSGSLASLKSESHRGENHPASVPASPSVTLPKLPTKPPASLSHLGNPGPPGAGLAPLYIPPPHHALPHHASSAPATPLHSSPSQPATPTGERGAGSLGPMRRRVSDKCNLPISAEIQRNREFYRTTDVRPPFTYASLIRQAIIESENKQLTLNEVYQWFQNTFAYFRRNEATWKNAVRHNLSLHKCFMRVENVKGAVWTVDEHEFYKRRPQKLTGAIPGSPSMAPDASLYGDQINASLRQQVAMFMNQAAASGGILSVSDSNGGGAEDLSMKSSNHSNGSDNSYIKSESMLDRDEMMFIKRESMYHEDMMNGSSPQDYSNSQSLDLSPRGNNNTTNTNTRQSSPLDNSHNSPKSHLSPAALSRTGSPQSRHLYAEPSQSDVFREENDMARNLLTQELYSRMMSAAAAAGQESKSNEPETLARRGHNESMDQAENYSTEVRTEEESKLENGGDKMVDRDEYPESSGMEQEKEVRESGDRYKYSAEEESRETTATMRSSPYSSNVQGDQILTNQEVYSPLLHASNMAVVSHSMT